ncbi:MAG: glycosyltransferase [Rikenellaceae bacterium]
MDSLRSPIVSVLMPIYGVERYIEEALRSIFEQSYEHCRYIFVNDATPDSSMEIFHRVVAEYPHRRECVTLIENRENMGIGATRNILLDNAQGDYLFFVDSDDAIDPCAVESMVVRAQLTRSELVRCGRLLEREDGGCTVDGRLWLGDCDSTLRAIVEQSHLITNHIYALLIDRRLVERHDIRFAEGVDMGEDYTFLVALLAHARRIDSVGEPLYRYRVVREGSYMHHISQRSVDSYVRANIWVTQYLSALKLDERKFRGSLTLGKLNIKKWLLRRGLSPVVYDNMLLAGWRIDGVVMRLYNWAINNRNNFIINVLFVWLNLWLIIGIFVSKYLQSRSNRKKQMWG